VRPGNGTQGDARPEGDAQLEGDAQPEGDGTAKDKRTAKENRTAEVAGASFERGYLACVPQVNVDMVGLRG
jgi:hypothetical protein